MKRLGSSIGVLLGIGMSIGTAARADEADDLFHSCIEYGKKKTSSPVDEHGGHCGRDGFYYDRFGGHYDEVGYQYKDGSYKTRCGERYDRKLNKIFERDGSEKMVPPELSSPKDRRDLLKVGCLMVMDYMEAAKASHPSTAEASRPADESPPQEGADAAHVLSSLPFAAGSSRFRSESASQRSLQAISAFMAQHRDITKLRIEGHTNSTGTDEASLALSRRRAAAVRDSLVQMGVESDRLEAIGFGETMPVADNATAAGRTRNDRVEFRIAETNGSPSQ